MNHATRERSAVNVPSDEFMDFLNEWRPFSRLVNWEQTEDRPRYREDQIRDPLSNSFFPYNYKLTRAILRDKHVMFIGDSLVRAMYKDLILLLQSGELCQISELKTSNEDEFHGDKQIDFLELDANRVFRQAREFQTNRHLIQYFFTNRAMREDLEKTCLMIEATDERPDLVVVNSAIWDVSRFPCHIGGRQPNPETERLQKEISVAEEYFNRIAMFCRRMRVLLPPTSTVVWLLMPPTATSELKERGFMSYNRLTHSEIRTRLLDANVRAAQIVREAGFDVLDLSFHMRLSSYQPFRVRDGVHWNPQATRFMNQLLMGHLATAWRLDRSVLKKWNGNICMRTNRETRSPLFNTAMHFLKDRNEEKHENENVNQLVRSLSLTTLDISSRRKLPGRFSLPDVLATLRTLLFFHKFDHLTSSRSNLHTMAFGTLPQELSRFSQEDINWITEAVKVINNDWRNTNTQNMIAFTNLNKRKHEPGRKTLLPTPSSVPSAAPVPSPFPTFTMTIPNRIADAEPYRPPPSKKRRAKN